MPEKKQVPILVCKVAGVTFNGRQQVLQRLLKGREIREILVCLEPEPMNPYDSNAVKVLAMGEHIGYVPREAAEDVLRALELGMVHERQKSTIGCAAKKNGGYVYWASLQVFEAATSTRGKPAIEKPKTYSDKPKRFIDLRNLKEVE